MKFPVLNIDGTKTNSLELSDKVVSLKVNAKLIKSVVDWQLNHAKPRTAKTKQRNEIRGSTKKIVAQKGSGGARHASKKAPIFVGGGVAHGPKGSVYKIKKINKKIRKIALAQSLSKKAFDKKLYILEDVKKMVYSVISPHFAGDEFLHPYIVYVAKGNTVLLEGRAVKYKSDITPERIRLPEGPIDIPEGTIKVLWRPGEEINERVCYDGVRSIDVSWWDNGDDYDYAQKRIREYSRDIIEYL